MNATRLINANSRLLNRPGNMTVAALINELQGLPDDAIVLFACDYGDYSHTQQALPVTEVQELGDCECLAETAYSRSRMAIENCEDGDDDADDFCGDAYEAAGQERPSVVILR